MPEENRLILVEVFAAGMTIFDIVKCERERQDKQDLLWFCHNSDGWYHEDEIVRWKYIDDISDWNEK